MAASTSLTPAERKLRASIAGHASWASTKDRTARGRNGQRGLYERFLREVDPYNELDEATRHKMAQSKYREHYQRLSFKAAKARRERKEQRERQAQEMKARRDAEAVRSRESA